jgi:hypothetical protein
MKVSRHVILLVVVLAFAAIMTAGLLTKSSRVHASASTVSHDCDHELPATAVRRQPLTNHALAHIPELE